MVIAAAVILALTYAGVAFSRIPRVNIDRPTAAVAGGVLMLLVGVLSFDEGVRAVDFPTLGLLLGMMLLIVVLQRAGLFTLLVRRSVGIASSPGWLLVAVVVATAVASAFLVNDVVVLLFTPIIIATCLGARLNPVPYLVGEAMASNIGSTATVIGNPQNAFIGLASGVSFARFTAHLAPVAAASLLVLLAVLWVFYRKGLALSPSASTRTAVIAPAAGPEFPIDRRVLRRTIPILLAATGAFFLSSVLDWSLPVIALSAGVGAMLVSGMRPAEVLRGVDWVLLAFFGGLFVVIGGAHQAGVLDRPLSWLHLASDGGSIVSLHIFSALASQAVSNVPLTLMLAPLLRDIPGDVLWITLASAATLAGNATLVGAVANLIVAEGAERHGVRLRFMEFLRVGVVVTILTILLSSGLLLLQFHFGFLK